MEIFLQDSCVGLLQCGNCFLQCGNCLDSLSQFLSFFSTQKLSLLSLGCLVTSRYSSEGLLEAFWNLRLYHLAVLYPCYTTSYSQRIPLILQGRTCLHNSQVESFPIYYLFVPTNFILDYIVY